jgi:hypothetical protein
MRDYRIDFFRGLALIVIFIDHIPFNIYSYMTPRNYGLSDAAEVFVLVSGVSAAFAYFGRYAAGETFGASARAIKRGLTLYVAHLFGTVAMLGMFAMAALEFEMPSFVQDNNFGPVFDDPVRGLAGVVSLGHQLGFFNILPMYIVLLMALPLMMLLARKSLGLMLGLSFLLYITAGTWELNLPAYPNAGGWFFNPFAWQFLFAIGFAAGARLRAGERVMPFSPWLWIAALAYLVVSGVWTLVPLWGTLPDWPLPFILYGSDKTFLTMGRLLHVLALAYVISQSPLVDMLKRRLTEWNPVVLLGRHALVTFVLGTLVSMVGLITKVVYEGGPLFDTLYVSGGLIFLVSVNAMLEWMAKPRRRTVAADAPAEPAIAAPLAVAVD